MQDRTALSLPGEQLLPLPVQGRAVAAVEIVARGRLRQKDCEFQAVQGYTEMHRVSKGRERKRKERNGTRRKGRGGREEASCSHRNFPGPF